MLVNAHDMGSGITCHLYGLVNRIYEIVLAFPYNKNCISTEINNHDPAKRFTGEDCRLQDIKQSSFLNCRLQERAFWSLVLEQALTSNIMQAIVGLI